MKVLMVDDHLMFLQGLKNLLGVLMPTLVVDTAERMSQAAGLAADGSYRLVLLDWNLEDSRGEDSIRCLRDVGCAAPIVVLSGETSPQLIRSVVELGAAGFIPKRYGSELMVAALDVVFDGGIYLPAEALREAPGAAAPRRDGLIDASERLAGLTARQVDVYRAAARGLPNKLIARELSIAESTVKTHLSAVYAVLGVRNRTEAAYQASREGIRVND